MVSSNPPAASTEKGRAFHSMSGGGALLKFLVLDFTAEEIAEQMTLIDFEEVSGIPFIELMRKNFSCPSKSPALTKISDRINTVCCSSFSGAF